MNETDIAPYDSPRPVTTKSAAGHAVPFLRSARRLAVMGFIGFALFLTTGLLFVVVAESFQLEIFPSIRWAFGVGAIGAILFLGSENFNSAKGQAPRFLTRFAASVAIFIVSGIVASVLGPRQPFKSEESDPYWLHCLLIFAAIFLPAMSIARLLRIRNRPAAD